MQTQPNIGYQQILNLISLLSQADKKRLIEDVKENLELNSQRTGDRQFGKYKGQIWMSDDFNEPLEEFNEYMP